MKLRFKSISDWILFNWNINQHDKSFSVFIEVRFNPYRPRVVQSSVLCFVDLFFFIFPFFLLAIVLYVRLWFTTSDYLFDFFKLFLFYFGRDISTAFHLSGKKLEQNQSLCNNVSTFFGLISSKCYVRNIQAFIPWDSILS